LFQNSIFVEHLKLKSVQMKWVIHSNDIFDLPDLYCIERSADVNPAHVHHFSVDQSLRQRDIVVCGCLRCIEYRNVAQSGGNCYGRDRFIIRVFERKKRQGLIPVSGASLRSVAIVWQRLEKTDASWFAGAADQE